MRTVLTFDYEIFFGTPAGTAQRCVIEPTLALSRVAMKHGAKLVFFVDAGWILRMRSEMAKSAVLRGEHDAVCRQVESLARDGHEIQLHIHPHWEDSAWGANGWRLDARRYALQSFDPSSVSDIVGRYSAALRGEHDAVCRQVESLAKDGHEIQLHIHPHWEDSWWGEDGWRLDARRYALHAFDAASVGDIVRRYSTVLREIAGAECAFARR